MREGEASYPSNYFCYLKGSLESFSIRMIPLSTVVFRVGVQIFSTPNFYRFIYKFHNLKTYPPGAEESILSLKT